MDGLIKLCLTGRFNIFFSTEIIPSILDCVLYLIHFVKCNILVLNIDIVHSEENTIFNMFNICSIKRCIKTPK